MINILYVFVNLHIGGAEEHLRTVVNNLDANLFRPVICCIREKGEIGDEIERSGFKVISLGRFSKSWDFRIVKDLFDIIRKEKIDLIHTHLYHANMYGRVAALMSKIPAVITEHNVYRKYKFKRRAINWILSKKTAKIIAVSEMVRKYVISRDHLEPSKVQLVHNGIDMKQVVSGLSKSAARKRIGIPTDRFLIGSVARLTEQKGHIYLIKAANSIKDDIPGLKILIAGSGPLESQIKHMVSNEKLEKFFLFLGARRDIPEILRALDVFVMPSLWEGFPMALLEAMSCSLPVVTTPVGGIPEVITNGVNGLIITPQDDISLTNAIFELYNNDGLRRMLGEKAQETVSEKFSALTMVRKLESVYLSSVCR